MISLEEPQKRTLSKEESFALRLKFIDFLYVLLFVYLTLHQFLIPFIRNILKDQVFYYDISWSFLIHLYGMWELKKYKRFSWFFYSFLGGLTLFQIIEGGMYFNRWPLFTLILTKGCTLIFLYFAYPFVEKKNSFLKTISALSLAVLMGFFFHLLRVDAPVKPRISERSVMMHEEDYQVNLPGSFKLLSEISVWELKDQVRNFEGEVKIINDRNHVIDIRLYELKIDEHRVKWKYKRLAQLRMGEHWILPLSNDAIYLVKSPERKDLKTLMLIPRNYKFPLGKGILSVGFHSIQWIGANNAE